MSDAADLRDRMADQNTRISVVENLLGTLATKQDLERVRGDLAASIERGKFTLLATVIGIMVAGFAGLGGLITILFKSVAP